MRLHMHMGALIALLGCGQGAEAPVVSLPVVAASEGMQPATTDLGYRVTVTTFRAAVRDIQLSVGGETHDASGSRRDRAFAVVPHPGHNAGGDITGELAGELVIDWMAGGATLGTATLIPGDYESANFAFRRAGASDGLAEDDPLLGHTFHIEGTADGGDGPVPFRAVLDVDEGTEMIGAPFAATIAEDATDPLRFHALTIDPFEGDTMFDGVDFAALASAEGVTIAPGQAAHNIMRRSVQVHDHYQLTIR